MHIPALSICSPSVLHWIPKPIIDSIHIQSLLYLLLWFGVFNYKICRNTSKDLGHNSRTSFYGGRPAWFFKTPFPEDFKSPVGDWLEHKQSMANQAGTNLRHICDRELSRRNRLRRAASFKVGDLVLVHHSRLPSWPRNCLQENYRTLILDPIVSSG